MCSGRYIGLLRYRQSRQCLRHDSRPDFTQVNDHNHGWGLTHKRYTLFMQGRVPTISRRARHKAGSKPFRSAGIRKRPLSRMILRGALQAVTLLPNMRGVCLYCHGQRAVCCPWLLILQDAAARLAGHAGRTGHRARIQNVGGAGGIRCHSTGRAVLQTVNVCRERGRCLHPPRRSSAAIAEGSL